MGGNAVTDNDRLTNNPFTRLADQQMVAATKAKHRRRDAHIARSEADAPMKLSEQEQAMADRQKLMANYRAANKAEFAKFLKGPDGKHWQDLRTALEYTSIGDADQLLSYIDRQDWLLNGSLKTRQDALALIAAHLIVLRLTNGYPPFDDSLPGEEMTLFEIIRAKLKVMT
jgi:hypothetical protein